MASSAAAARSLRLCVRGARAPAGPPTAPEPPRRAHSGAAGGLKSIDELPGPSLPTTLYWLFLRGYADKSHLLQGVQRSLYGPMWRSRFGPLDIVNVASPELIAQVIQQEGCYPTRVELPHWKEYRELRGQAYGLHVDTGPEWYRIRSTLNPKMLKLREVSAYAPLIQQVVGDLLERVEFLRWGSRDGATVSDVAAELHKFGFEGISSILFETRLGCLREEIPAGTQRFISAVNTMMTLSETVLLLPRWCRRLLPFWGRFVRAWDDLYDVARVLIDRRISDVEAQEGRGRPAEGMFLTSLLSSRRLSRAEVYITVTEMLLGAVDTTSNTLSWALYRLARHRGVQDRLHGEVSSVCPHRREPSAEDLSRMPYLKAVIKETLRLYPVVPGNGRFVAEAEVVVGNYRFPKKTQFHLCHYATCHDEEQFEGADLFAPERWLRPEASGAACRAAPPPRHHPYSFIPFGVGVRACVGKRVAEMEMFLALSRLIQHYDVRPEPGDPPVGAKTRTLLIPAKPINLRFLPRA
ncbi:sterol 26-hydroxylase, mitochondrial [Pungitius pungitius]|uniref:sterol 26-hydroxylase, mitochondrial n=1 Tax=Pungitius pungitius TaxID=134920 RepID=UPI002E147892